MKKYHYENIRGFDRVIRKFNKLENAFGGDGYKLEGVLFECAKMIRDSAKKKVPVRTGQLRDAIVAKKFSYRIKDKPAAFAAIDYGTKATVLTLYGHLVEFGTVKSGAHPFFRPAVTENRQRIIDRIKGEAKRMVHASVRG